MKLVKTLAALLVIVLVFGAAMFGLNFYTGPIIEANNAGAEFAPLLAVMPEGAAFDGEARLELAALKDVPASVVSVYREAAGLGYAIRCTAESSYSTAPMEITIGISADGKICGVQIDSYNDSASFDFRAKDPGYLGTYIGKDSALADVGTVSGSTFSSTAFKDAVSQAMGVLIANDMIAAGVKTDAQILAELIPTLHTGLTSGGLLKAEGVAASGNITEGYKALNGSGYAFIVQSGETSVLAIVNAAGTCRVYDTTGADVTEANAAICDEALTAAGQAADFTEEAGKRITAACPDASDITAVPFTSFGNVVYAASLQSGGKTCYAFYSRPLTYEDNVMAVTTVIDENGAIVSQDVKELLFGHGVEYLPAYHTYGDTGSANFKAYEGKFAGLTADKISDEILISGATISSTAVKLATQDAFTAFESVQNGGAK